MKVKNWEKLEYHDYCTLFPEMQADEYAGLVADIKENGVIEKITLYEVEPGVHQILDGRNRHLACLDSGAEPEFEEYAGGNDPLKWVISKNVGRRHLSTGQLAALASEVADAAIGMNQFSGERTYTREQAAIVFGTSVKSIQRYREIVSLSEGIAQRVANGDLALTPGLQEAKQHVENGTAEFNENSTFGTDPDNLPAEEHDPAPAQNKEFKPLSEDPDGEMMNNRMRLSNALERIENRESVLRMTLTADQVSDLSNGFCVRMTSGSVTVDVMMVKK